MGDIDFAKMSWQKKERLKFLLEKEKQRKEEDERRSRYEEYEKQIREIENDR